MARSRKKLGEVLLGWGLINQKQLDEGLAKATKSGMRIGEALIDLGAVKDDQVAKALAHQQGMEYVDLAGAGIAGKVDPKLIPEEMVKKHLILPLSKSNGRLQLVIHDPMDLELLDMLRFRLNVEVDPKLSSRSQIKWFIENKLNQQEGKPAMGSLTADVKMVEAGKSLVTASIDKSIDKSVDRSVDKSIDIAGDDAPIVKLVTRMIVEAVKMRASDIHIEPMADRVRLRYRIDGVCMERDNLPKRMQNAVLSRVKLMAGMNIAEKRVPQDGRIKLPIDEKQVDFRVSACPSYHGESVVLRVLRPDSVKIGLVNIGFEEDNLAQFNKIIRRPNGIFLVTGPTGSGKTTTLYTALDILNRPDKKIITAEDPIEYNFEGINQVQINEKIGLGFKEVLKSMLRQAPNIILVGEIRDREVADIAIQAALTGHLVFSTLHTNDAPSAITRLIDMGVKPFLVASSIQAILAQRLIRVLCKECKSLADVDEVDPKFMLLTGITKDEARGRMMKPVGCPACGNAGYRGRQAIFELMQMNSEIRELAFNLAPIGQIRHAAIVNGMRPLVHDGKTKILKGVTTCDEVAKMAQVEGITVDEPA